MADIFRLLKSEARIKLCIPLPPGINYMVPILFQGDGACLRCYNTHFDTDLTEDVLNAAFRLHGEGIILIHSNSKIVVASFAPQLITADVVAKVLDPQATGNNLRAEARVLPERIELCEWQTMF